MYQRAAQNATIVIVIVIIILLLALLFTKARMGYYYCFVGAEFLVAAFARHLRRRRRRLCRPLMSHRPISRQRRRSRNSREPRPYTRSLFSARAVFH